MVQCFEEIKTRKEKADKDGKYFETEIFVTPIVRTFDPETQLKKTIRKMGASQTEEEKIIVPGDLAFDHARTIVFAVDRLRSKIEYADLVFNLMSEYFTLTQLQQVYETILDKDF